MVGVGNDGAVARDALRACGLFAGLDAPSLELVAGALRSRRFRKGEVVFHAGDPGDALFIVAAGHVKITLPADDGSEPAILTTVGPGGFFGELALLDGQPRSATATTVEPTETLSLPRDVFRELLDKHPELRDALFAALANLLRRLTKHVEELHFLDLAGRLAARLAQLARQGHPGATHAIELDWPYTQSDLAAMIGGTRQSVNKLLTGLVDDDLLHIDHETLIINDLERLEAHGAR